MPLLTGGPRRLDFAKDTAGVGVSGNREMIFTPPGGALSGCAPDGMSPAAAPSGLDIRSADLVRLLYPPKVLKLASSQDFNVNDYRVALAAGAGSTAKPASLSFTAPKDQVGWIQQFAIYTLTPTALTSVKYTLLINGAPVAGYDNINNPPGIANLVEVFYNDIAVRLPMGSTVSVLFTQLDGTNPETVGAQVRGWYHPKVAEDRAWGIDP